MQKLYYFLSVIFFALTANAQVFNQSISDKIQKVDSVLNQLIAYENIGTKPTGSPALVETLQWISNKYRFYGYNPVIDTFKLGSNESYNIIIEKQGANPSQWIIIGAHYDSVDESPGANDNGSGVVATLQIARIIKDLIPKIGVRIINFGAEEQGFIGSSHYVKNTLLPSDSIILMLNLDQLGGTKGEDNSKIYCERDDDTNPSFNNAMSSLMTDTLSNLISLYTKLTPVISDAYSSDYVPFENEGMIITGLYQESDYSDHYHKSTDLVSNMDVDATVEVIKGALAATLYFSGMNGFTSVNKLVDYHYELIPNPANNYFTITHISSPVFVEIYGMQGSLIHSQQVCPNEQIELFDLPNGLYTVGISDHVNNLKIHTKLIIVR
ncbi:MAG: M28 family peptidase [Bacteroidia bacterium]|mgnify:FL=1|nr:M28 family peptidase [Bacteroidia bacterium]|tara:strand:- start:793 stop:1938 length:1146 start_codon:yes stop_codon:yes gene_type:complete